MSGFFARYGDKKLFVMMNRHILFFNNVWKTVHRGANAKNGVTTERRVFRWVAALALLPLVPTKTAI